MFAREGQNGRVADAVACMDTSRWEAAARGAAAERRIDGAPRTAQVTALPVHAQVAHHEDRDVDPAGVEQAVRDLLRALGRNGGEENLRDTPRRVAAAFGELLTPAPITLTTFPNDEAYDELVVVTAIPFHSLCMHHLLPFHGVAHVAYLPGERIIGLSKLPRVVDLFARDLQLQERLTMQVADCLERHLRPKGVGVVLEAEHMCMTLRGVQKAGARTTTSALRGLLRDDARTRGEFLSLVKASA